MYKEKATLLGWLFYANAAVWTGLEPATSAVTGRHSNQLNYQTVYRSQKALSFSVLVLQR